MTTYDLQLSKFLKIDDASIESPTLQLLKAEIDKSEKQTQLLQYAAAMVHAECAVNQIKQRIYEMREALRGRLAGTGIKDWRLGIR